MKLWQDLVKQGIVGTRRQADSAWQWPAEQLAQRAASWQELPGEQQYLNALALIHSYSRAGRVPWQERAITVDPCPQESLPWCTGKVAALLNRAHSEENLPFIVEACGLLQAHGQLLEPSLLPALLDLAVKHKVLITHIAPVLGRRGQWLCALNEDWAVLGLGAGSESVTEEWITARRSQRLVLLRQALAQDWEGTVAQLKGLWSSENAKDRLLLLQQFSPELIPEDEIAREAFTAWLKDCQQDRSQGVRAQATGTLARLGEESTSIAIERGVLACLTVQRKLTRSSLEVQPPEQYEPDWKPFGIGEKLSHLPSGSKIGARAGLLFQWLSLADPLALASNLGIDMGQLLKLAAKSDYKEACLLGFDAGARLHGAADYLPLRFNDITKAECLPWLESMRDAFPDAALQPLVADTLAALPKKRKGNKATYGVALRIAQCVDRLTEPMTRTLLELLLAQLSGKHVYKDVQRELSELAWRLPLSLLPEWSDRLTNSDCDGLFSLLKNYQQRYQLQQEFADD